MSVRPERSWPDSRSGRIAIGAALCGASLLAGCAVGPDFVRPVAPVVQHYTHEPPATDPLEAGGDTQRFVAGADLPDDWWRLFASAPLDATVRQALANSPTLQAAEASLRQSQDNLRAGDGVFYPRLDAGFGAERLRSAPTQQGSSARGSVFDVVALSGDVSYPLDVFGAERRAVEGLRARVDNQRFAARAAFLALSANVVDACIARAAYAAQIRATERLVALEREQLGMIDVQVRAGTALFADSLSQLGLIAANEALLAVLQQKRSQAGHLLALLQGTSPAEATLPEIALDALALPPDLPVSLPSELVRQRPDILAAEAQLHSASADIGVATAALFPSFGIDASFGRADSSLARLFGAGSAFWSVGPSLVAPLFHGGALRAQRQAAVDAYDVQQANYRQTVLAAFAQVADALDALEHDAQALRAQLQAERATAQALTLLQANYRAGLVAYADVLNADLQYQQASIGALQAQAQRRQDTVALFAAVGGGWWNRQDVPGTP